MKKSASQSLAGRYAAAIGIEPISMAYQGGNYGLWEATPGAAAGDVRRGHRSAEVFREPVLHGVESALGRERLRSLRRETLRSALREGDGQAPVHRGCSFRCNFVGNFEGVKSHRSVCWRCADSRSLAAFLGVDHPRPKQSQTASLNRLGLALTRQRFCNDCLSRAVLQTARQLLRASDRAC